MTELEQGHAKRLRELQVMRAPKRTRKEDIFAIMPLWTAALAAEATRSPALLVWAYILYCARKDGKHSFLLPNGWLERRGVRRQAKYRILGKLEAYGLISVEMQHGKSPRITVHL
jgi:hypothetical protein